MEDSSSTRGNSTILIGANLLGVAAQFNGPASLTSIAQAAGMSPSRAYRYLRGLCDSGLMEQIHPSGLYDLGPQLLLLGLKAIGRMDPVRQASAILPALTNATGLASVISVWGSHGPTALRCEQGELVAPVRIREGITLSLLQTAAGKVFLAYLPVEQTELVLARELEQRENGSDKAGSIAPAKIARIQEEVRRNGLGRSVGTFNPMYTSLASPVFDRQGRLQLTISLIGVKGSADFTLKGPAAARLRSAAQDVSNRLGATESPT